MVLLQVQRLNVPDTLCILIDTSVTSKETHTRNTNNSLASPLILVFVGLINECLSLNIAVEVVRDEVVVTVIFDCTNKSSEARSITKGVGFNGVEDFEKIWVKSVRAVVMGVTQVFNVFCKVSEEKDVVFADLTSDFNLLRLGLSQRLKHWIDLHLLRRKYQ